MKADTSMGTIFISHSHEDARIAIDIRTILESMRTNPQWMPHCTGIFLDDYNLGSGDRLASIMEEIARAIALIVILSPPATQSEWIAREVYGFAKCHHYAPIVPLVVDDCDFTNDPHNLLDYLFISDERLGAFGARTTDRITSANTIKMREALARLGDVIPNYLTGQRSLHVPYRLPLNKTKGW